MMFSNFIFFYNINQKKRKIDFFNRIAEDCSILDNFSKEKYAIQVFQLLVLLVKILTISQNSTFSPFKSYQLLGNSP